MANLPGILLALLCVQHRMAEANGDYMTNTARLLDDLFKDYNSWVIPIHQGPVKVVHGIQLLRILDFDPYKRIATVDVWSSMDWTDTRLQWDPSQYGGNVTKVMVPIKTLWLPDILLSSGGPSPPGDEQANVHNDGKVLYISRTTTLTAYCSDTNITDEFECHLKFMSWVYDGTMLDLQLNEYGSSADLSSAILPDHHKWEVASFTADRNVVRYACCPEPFIDLVYQLRIRQPGFSVSMRVESGQCSVVMQNGHTVLSITLVSLVLWLWS